MQQNICMIRERETDRQTRRKRSHVQKGLWRENWQSLDYNMFLAIHQDWLQTNGKKISLPYAVIGD